MSEPSQFELLQAADAVYALAASPDYARDGICFAACSSGLHRSQDGGQSWQPLPLMSEQTEHSAPLAATALAISPDFRHDRSLFTAVKGGILRSSDGGDVWFTAGFPAPPPLFSALAISPNYTRDGLLLAAAMEDGIFASADRATHWQPWNFGLFDLNVLSLALSPHLPTDETVFAGTETGLYRSTNGGRAWRATDFPTECAPVLCLACSDATLFAGTENHGLLASDTQGSSWRRLAENHLPQAVNGLQFVPHSAGRPRLFALAADGILASADEGRSWQRLLQTDSPPTALCQPNPAEKSLLAGLLGKGIVRLQFS